MLSFLIDGGAQPPSPPEAPSSPDNVYLSLESQFIWSFPSDAHKDSLTLYKVLAESDFNSSAGVPPKPGELVRPGAAPSLLRALLQTQPITWFYFKS